METQASEIERNKAVVRRFVEQVQNKKDFTVYDELTDPEFVNLSAPPGVPADSEGGRMWLSTSWRRKVRSIRPPAARVYSPRRAQ